MSSSQGASQSERWTIKPELLIADNGAQITMGIAYGSAPAEALEVMPVASVDAIVEAANQMAGAFRAHMVSTGYGTPEQEDYVRGAIKAYEEARDAA